MTTTMHSYKEAERAKLEARQAELNSEIEGTENALVYVKDNVTGNRLGERLASLQRELAEVQSELSNNRRWRESFHDFRSRMDCECFTVALDEVIDVANGDQLGGGCKLFANGAYSDGSWHTEPPTDPQDLAVNRLAFLGMKLSRIEANTELVANSIREQTKFHSIGAGPAADDEQFGHLEKQVTEIKAIHREQDELWGKYPELRPRPRRSDMANYCSTNPHAAAEVRQRLEEIGF
jgi:hypothetical protein